ncbi:MAG: COX15/CtaA family protein [Cellvibrionales bacterium]|nr:COX15/CtaA family protein [Cellvibrionales bacterium]
MLIQRLSLAATLITLALIVLGAFVRLSDAGLGCPDWPTCYGHVLWPQDEQAIASANSAFAKTPVETNKTWPEQVHRLLASSLGLFALVLFGLAFKKRLFKINRSSSGSKLSHSPHPEPTHTTHSGSRDDRMIDVGNQTDRLFALFSVSVAMLLLIARIVLAQYWIIDDKPVYDAFDPAIGIAMLTLLLLAVVKLLQSNAKCLLLSAVIVIAIILQGLFGMWTVTLKLWPQVVSLHLLGGMLIACLFYLLFLYSHTNAISLQSPPFIAGTPLRKHLSIAFFSLLLMQILLGGWVSSNYAAVACADFPTCQGKFWPDADFAKGFTITQSIGPNYLGGMLHSDARAAIHFTHRLGALIVLLMGFVFYFLLLRNNNTKIMACIGLSLLAIQMGLGISNLLFQFPMALALLHTLFAGLLLLNSLHCLVACHIPNQVTQSTNPSIKTGEGQIA